ncbi:MAG TPA: YvcK family protein [Bryobacteraceae bacterium]|nr:YvcK family protein [Bryobacteraceae bacterium]
MGASNEKGAWLDLSSRSPLRVVSIGGGNGLSTLLKGLKEYSHVHAQLSPPHPLIDITAVVTVTDDGGSSGRLRREFDVLPPGDIRNCMVALAEDEGLLTRLFSFRFDSGRGLRGHSFGNLFLTVMSQVTGDFSQAVRLSSEVLAIAGRIYPSTSAQVTLRAHLEGGEIVDGESRISRSTVPIRRIELLPGGCLPLQETLKAIREADLITLGPGSLFTSVVPNLLVQGIPAAIRRSKALKACFVNLMSQPGETTGLTASEHVKAICDHAGARVVDVAVLNNSPVTAPARRRYARESAVPVVNDLDAIRAMGIEVACTPLIEVGEKVRHNPAAAGRVALQLAKRGRRARLNLLKKRSS